MSGHHRCTVERGTHLLRIVGLSLFSLLVQSSHTTGVVRIVFLRACTQSSHSVSSELVS
jgi:hypothetical protein